MRSRSRGLTRRDAMLAAGALSLSRPAAAQTPGWTRYDVAASAFWEPLDRQMIAALPIRKGDRLLDAGCGRGDHLWLLAERTTGRERVAALDRSSEALAKARARFAGSKFESRVTFHESTILDMPFADAEFDLVWISHVLHAQPDIVGTLRRLRSAIRRGGAIAVREDRSTAFLLPYDVGIGEPGLEARLTAAFVKWFVEDRLQRGRYPHGWTQALSDAGFARTRVQSFLHQVSPPFSKHQQDYLHEFLARKRDWPHVSDDDRQTLETLTNRKSPAYFLNRTDLHFTSVSTVYLATAP